MDGNIIRPSRFLETFLSGYWLNLFLHWAFLRKTKNKCVWMRSRKCFCVLSFGITHSERDLPNQFAESHSVYIFSVIIQGYTRKKHVSTQLPRIKIKNANLFNGSAACIMTKRPLCLCPHAVNVSNLCVCVCVCVCVCRRFESCKL